MFKKVLIVLAIILAVAGYFGYEKYKAVLAPNVNENLENPFVNIPTGANFEEVVTILKDQHILIDEASFRWVAEQMKYIKPQMRAGRYEIQPGWSNRNLVSHLRGGKQSTVKVILNNERLPEEVAGKVSKVIEADSSSIFQLLQDKLFLQQYGLTPETAMTVFIPNTYDFFWNRDAKAFFEKMLTENEKFWSTNSRLQKATDKGMSKEEVYTLASIVERETNQKDEKERMAGVYVNRLRIGMPLQADPTVIFATRDFGARRVLNKHTEYNSPYNTYMYAGLPPGPISMSSISSIDAVLNAEDHDYLYFCARGDGSGYHAFAKTLSGHNVNAQRYAENLRKRGLR